MGWLLAFAVSACGSDGGEDPVGPDPAVAPFVGLWAASEFTFTTDADPPTVADLLTDGSFTVDIQPSGFYTATLIFGDLPPLVEFGKITVSGDLITLTPNAGPGPCLAPAEYDFPNPDTLVLDGPSCLDVNLDGEDEDGQAHIVLSRQGGSTS